MHAKIPSGAHPLQSGEGPGDKSAAAVPQPRPFEFPISGTRSRSNREVPWILNGVAPCVAIWSAAGNPLRCLRMKLTVGQRFTWERTFTSEDVRQFAEVSGDYGAHHVEPATDGRVMVQGLLTATLPTKIGGDLSFMAREMTFEFVRPVFSGDTVITEVKVVSVEPEGSRQWASIEAVCRNQDGKDVLLVRIRGFVAVPDAAGHG